ncbi:MAG TPA: nicotinate-nucleotide adenylyltransferase [Candidatus Binataceae bacterium]|nr:nicotinate-nucleotide adenylyltransferase [Candidatus Binataceae bacterium]
MRIGLFGGSFNPIHFGHLRSAEEVREALGLDIVYFVPAASPPHKEEGGLAPAEHRLNMVRLATKGNRHFMVSDAEMRRPGRSYTVDTVRHFLATLRDRGALYLLMGADAFGDLETWKDCDEIVRLASLAVHTRVGEDGTITNVALVARRRFGYTQNDGILVNPSGQTLSFIPTPAIYISATLLREKLRQGLSVRYLIPNEVLDYIARHGIY